MTFPRKPVIGFAASACVVLLFVVSSIGQFNGPIGGEPLTDVEQVDAVGQVEGPDQETLPYVFPLEIHREYGIGFGGNVISLGADLPP